MRDTLGEAELVEYILFEDDTDHPGDDDGNSGLADSIKELLHEGADLLDD